jgi:glycosyltransferase involved in cell wall biosynthesis
MKSVVMIAYNFAPEGNAGAHRPLRFVRHLPAQGWKPTVITLETKLYERYDLSLLAQVPHSVKVVRVPNRDPWVQLQERRTKRVQQRNSRLTPEKLARIETAHKAPFRSFIREAIRTIEGWCYHPDPAMGWIGPAVKTIKELHARQSRDVILATGGPWSSFIVAERASRLTGVPYVLDFRDAWTLTWEPFADTRPFWATLYDRRTLYRLLKNAQAIIFRYETEAECYWRAYPGALDSQKIHLIPNGFDGAVEEVKRVRKEKCQILYTGTLAYYRYDTMLEALARLKKDDERRIRQLRLLFVGEQSDALYAQAAKLGLSEIVISSPPVSHAEILSLQQESDALLMLEREPTVKGHELLAGAKLFGYLKAGRPIVGILPHGEAKKILRRVGVSTLADVQSADEIIKLFDRVLRAWEEQSLSLLVPNPISCAAFSAEKQVTVLTRALEARAPAEEFVPGVADVPASIHHIIGEHGWIHADRSPLLLR